MVWSCSNDLKLVFVVTWNGIDEMRWGGVGRVVIMMDGSIPMNYAHQFIYFFSSILIYPLFTL